MSNEHFDFHLPKRKWVPYFSNQQMILICLSSPAVFRTNTLFPCHARIITVDLAMEVYNTWWKLSVSIPILNGTSSAGAGAPKKGYFSMRDETLLINVKANEIKKNYTVHHPSVEKPHCTLLCDFEREKHKRRVCLQVRHINVKHFWQWDVSFGTNILKKIRTTH